MSNREIVIDLLAKLPEDAPLEVIAREIEFWRAFVPRGSRRNDGRALTPTMSANSSTHGLASNPH
jgi:hypothetical protein